MVESQIVSILNSREKQMKKSILLVWILALLISVVYAQSLDETIRKGTWSEKTVMTGVIWKHAHFDNLYNSLQDIWYADVDLNNPKLKLTIPFVSQTTRMTVSQFAAKTPNAVVVINGNFFTFDGNSSKQYLKVDGKVWSETVLKYPDAGGLMFDKTGRKIQLVQRDRVGGWQKQTTENIIATDAALIINGELWSYPSTKRFQSDRHPRTALGLTRNNHLLMVIVDGRTKIAAGMTMVELQKLMKVFKAEDAINMDGGGSSTLWCKGEPKDGVVNHPSGGSQRPVANAIAVIVRVEKHKE